MSHKLQNILKSQGRSSKRLGTENLFQYVHDNMPALSSWNPRPKGKQQKYFCGVFENAANTDDAHQENEDNFVEAKVK